ncbi:phosphodiester glycosidase family protein [Paenibacillus agaridevorans]|uniref:phosphodiester glycosidase family protein n=1 Tax=Paenibacillus agaridevorans TaxID=171404 RepID=UPI001BE4C2A9|nr:phosphodiester glycosidase family protein [Paenibacillus agaridevorans]
MNHEAGTPPGSRRKQVIIVVSVFIAVIAVATVIFMLLVQSLNQKSEQKNNVLDSVAGYTYQAAEATNGLKLHILKTKPANVTLEVISNNVTLSGKAGVNGGFFYGTDLMSLAVVGGHPVNGAKSDYGSGWENMKYARGTLVWDGKSDSLSVQVVRQSTELKVKDVERFWAQGGISMSLGDDAGWQAQILAEAAPFPDDLRLRSGAVYDDKGFLYLIVSETPGTLESFRDGIKELLDDQGLVDGIFLDGDGSSQLLSKEAALPGDNRPVVQMIRIMK